MEVSELEERLRVFIREQGNFTDVTIANLHKMPGGASREIWSFDCTMQGARGTETRGMVLRATRPRNASRAIGVTSF